MAGLSRMSDEEQSLIKSIVLMTEPEELRRGCVPLPDVEEQNAFWTGWCMPTCGSPTRIGSWMGDG